MVERSWLDWLALLAMLWLHTKCWGLLHIQPLDFALGVKLVAKNLKAWSLGKFEIIEWFYQYPDNGMIARHSSEGIKYLKSMECAGLN